MRIGRDTDAAFLNSVANDPDVRPHLGGSGPLDLAPVLAAPGNIGLVCDIGGFLLTRIEPGVFEVHSMFLPGHGAKPVKAMRAAQEWMFTRTECATILSKVPKGNTRAKGFAVIGGLRPIFERDHEILGPCEFVELGIMRWAMGAAALETHGERFHAFLEKAKIAAGSTLTAHPHDTAHERAVGAALLMIERGQPAKGVAFYNSWARFAGYAEIDLLGTDPVMVDVRDAIVCLNGSGLEMIECR